MTHVAPHALPQTVAPPTCMQLVQLVIALAEQSWSWLHGQPHMGLATQMCLP
jgi:hypothetical protein